MAGKDDRAITCALGLWGLWTFATWWFEGRIETFGRPDAVADRLIYTVVANVLVGVLGGTLLLRKIGGSGPATPKFAGFGSWQRTLVWVPVGLGLGLVLYFGQGAPSTDPVVILNAYSQVFVVSLAEVIVCWSLVGGMITRGIAGTRWISVPVAAVVASALFGAYHFAHSPPFNSIQMVIFLSAIGLVTSAFYFMSRDVYATAFFHNFLGTFGVVQALAASEQLDAFQSPQIPLIVTAVAALLMLVGADILLVRSPR